MSCIYSYLSGTSSLRLLKSQHPKDLATSSKSTNFFYESLLVLSYLVTKSSKTPKMVLSHDASSTGADTSHPNPNGDVALVVSPPIQPRAYTRPECPLSLSTQDLSSGTQQANSTNQPKDDRPQKRIFKVSSRYLILASKYFEGRLRPCWSEGEILRDKGTVELDIRDTDPDALLILLDIIHGHTRRVPRAVGLIQLCELAVLIDYLQCHEAAEVFSIMLVAALRQDVSYVATDNMLRWIFVSWVFREVDIFKSATRKAQRTAMLRTYTLDLPIPRALMGECCM